MCNKKLPAFCLHPVWIFDSVSDWLPVQLPVEADLSELRAPIQLQSGGERSAEGRGGGGSVPAALPLGEKAPAASGWHIDPQTAGAFPPHTSGFTSADHIPAGLWAPVNVPVSAELKFALIVWERWDGPDGPGPHGACGAAPLFKHAERH